MPTNYNPVHHSGYEGICTINGIDINVKEWDFTEGPTWEDVATTGDWIATDGTGKGFSRDFPGGYSGSGTLNLILDTNRSDLYPALRPGIITAPLVLVRAVTGRLITFPQWQLGPYKYTQGGVNAAQKEAYSFKNHGYYVVS